MKSRCACSLLILPIVLYNISRLLHMQTNHNIFIRGSFDQAQAPCSAYPSRAFTMHAAADSVLLGFMFCVLSGRRIPLRDCGIVGADLPKSRTERN